MNFKLPLVHCRWTSPLGPMLLAASARGLAGAWFAQGQRDTPDPSAWPEAPEHPVLRAAAQQLGAYFAGRRRDFDLPLDLRACSRSVWGRAGAFSGWDARRGAPPIAELLASIATPQTARKDTCPSGWDAANAVAFASSCGDEVPGAQPTGCASGRFAHQSPCMGISPCGGSWRPTHPDCVPTRPHTDREQALSHGTAFQQAVWQALGTIASGQTQSYGALARRIGRPRAVRALGAAVGSNPVSIIVPCHRVLGADGSLTGYGGGLERKTALLQLEGVLPAALDLA